jgi:sugar lactone lactonase YvrE
MFKLFFSVLISLTLLFSVNAQTVSTLVAGPSTFNDGLAADKDGNIYAALYYGTTVTKITPEGLTSIFASGFSSPNGLKFGPDGYLYVTNPATNKISRVSMEGDVSDFININTPSELYFDKDGLLYVTNYLNGTVSTIDTAKNITVIFSGSPLNGPIGILKDNEGTLYIGNFTDGKVFRIDNDSVFVEIGDLPGWLGFMILIGDNIYATAYQDNRIYKIPIDGSGQTVFAGTGTAGGADGDVLSAQFNSPNGITASSTGDTIYVSEYNPRRLRMITGVLGTTATGNNEQIPEHFNLEQNYPNPFNPETKIRYTVAAENQSSLVILKVFDVLGRDIKTLVNENKSSGSYEVSFKAKNLTSGVYFYRIEIYSGNSRDATFSETKKMLVLK